MALEQPGTVSENKDGILASGETPFDRAQTEAKDQTAEELAVGKSTDSPPATKHHAVDADFKLDSQLKPTLEKIRQQPDNKDGELPYELKAKLIEDWLKGAKGQVNDPAELNDIATSQSPEHLS